MREWRSLAGFAATLSLVVVSCDSPHETGNPSPPEAVDAGPCGAAVESCPADRCAGGVCALVAIAGLGSLGAASVFGVDASYVYLATMNGFYRAPRCGGSVQTLALSPRAFAGPTLSGDYIYFRFVGLGTSVLRMPKAGGASSTIFDGASDAGSVTAVQPMGQDVYMVLGSSLAVAPASGGTPDTLIDDGGFIALGADEDYLYFVQPGGSSQRGLYRLKSGERAPELLLPIDTASNIISAPAADADAVYVAFGVPGPVSLERVAKVTDTASVVAVIEGPAAQLASDGRCVYYVTGDGSSIGMRRGLRRVPVGGGEPELLASSADGVAFDDSAYYFTSGGYLFRHPK